MYKYYTEEFSIYVDGGYERNTFQYSSWVLDRYISEVGLEQPPLCSPQSCPWESLLNAVSCTL